MLRCRLPLLGPWLLLQVRGGGGHPARPGRTRPRAAKLLLPPGGVRRSWGGGGGVQLPGGGRGIIGRVVQFRGVRAIRGGGGACSPGGGGSCGY